MNLDDYVNKNTTIAAKQFPLDKWNRVHIIDITKQGESKTDILLAFGEQEIDVLFIDSGYQPKEWVDLYVRQEDFYAATDLFIDKFLSKEIA